MLKPYFTLAVLLLFFVSCKKAEVSPDGLESFEDASPSAGILAVNPYVFDWETADFMPYPGNVQIPVPWGSGGSSLITPEILHDYKRQDGWELVYNTFDPVYKRNELYFVLYNKFRGLIRFYFYAPSDLNLSNSSNMVHSLTTIGQHPSSSPILNYAAATLVDFNQNVTNASMVEHWQIARNAWYAFQYELAYDANISAHSYSSLSFRWPVKVYEITSLKLNGQSNGEVLGTISIPGTDFTLSPSLNVTGDGNLTINGSSDVEKVKPKISTQLYNNLKSLVTKNITGGVGGVVENLLNGIFGGQSDQNSDNVNLRIKSKIEMAGELTGDALLTTPQLAVPGYSQNNTPTFIPLYNEPLGVFYINSKPKVNLFFESQLLENKTYVIRQDYKLDASSFEVIFNESLEDEVDFSSVRKEIVLFGVPDYTAELYGTKEIVGNETVYTHAYPYFVISRPRPRVVELDAVGVRISFDVIPKNGSKKTKIVKTFLAEVVEK